MIRRLYFIDRLPVHRLVSLALSHITCTHEIWTAYDNRIMVVATQTGTVGTVLEAHADQTLDPMAPTFSIATLMGRRDEPNFELSARALIERMQDAGCTR